MVGLQGGITLKNNRNVAATVDPREFLLEMKHSRKDEIEAVRAIVLSADSNITERIKWNAPSFCIDDDDRITFRLQPGDRVQLIFHRGAKKRTDSATFTFEDNSGLLEWAANDRAVVTFRDLDDIKSKSAALKGLVAQWMATTRTGHEA